MCAEPEKKFRLKAGTRVAFMKALSFKVVEEEDLVEFVKEADEQLSSKRPFLR